MDPESTPTSSTASNSTFSTVGDFAQLEALLAGRMKSLESELAGLRRDLQEARRQEVRAGLLPSALVPDLCVTPYFLFFCAGDCEGAVRWLEEVCGDECRDDHQV